MRSFAYKVKGELCRAGLQRHCCCRAEAYGVLLYCNTFTPQEIRIITENQDFAARLPRLFKKAFDLRFDFMPESEEGSGKLIFRIENPDKLDQIISQLGYDARQSAVVHVNFGLLEEDCCRSALLRGAFLSGGSVTDPEKRYHLELATSHAQASREMCALLSEMGFSPRIVKRGGSSVIYFKQCEYIEDFLTTIGAPAAAVEIMTTKLAKEVRNDVNRVTNCDMANVNKTVAAAQAQCEAIEKLRNAGKLEEQPPRLQETALLRMENPELSLEDIAKMCEPPVTKSCINHRMRKLMEAARELN